MTRLDWGWGHVPPMATLLVCVCWNLQPSFGCAKVLFNYVVTIAGAARNVSFETFLLKLLCVIYPV